MQITGLWVIMMWQCGFLRFNKRTSLVRDADNAGGCARVGAEGTWEISGLSAEFCRKPETVLKVKSTLKKVRERNNKLLYTDISISHVTTHLCIMDSENTTRMS